MATLEGNELRRAVAEALGYKIEYHNNNRNYIVILAPDGRRVYGPTNAEWTYLVYKWASEEGGVPDYPNDLNTVTAMPLPENSNLELTLYDDGSAGAVLFISDETGRCIGAPSAGHKLLATAAWNVWLALPEDVRKAALLRNTAP